MPQAYAEYGKLSGQLLNQLYRNSRFLRGTRTRRNHDLFRFARGNLLHGNFIVAMHFHGAAKLAQVLRQVISEGIVVIQQQNHLALLRPLAGSAVCAASSARSSALVLFTDSVYSPSGVESATIPPPAWMCATPCLITMVRSAMQKSRLPAKSRYKMPPA